MVKQSLLLVDDEPNILATLRRVLNDEGYFIYTAGSGEEGLRIVENENIDLIISDQKMPGMDGLEFLERTIVDHPEIIRILLTGNAELDDTIRAINSGCLYKFIIKPWNNQELKITLKRALEQKELIVKNKFLATELKIRNNMLDELEKQYPGITERPEDGIYRIDFNESNT